MKDNLCFFVTVKADTFFEALKKINRNKKVFSSCQMRRGVSLER